MSNRINTSNDDGRNVITVSNTNIKISEKLAEQYASMAKHDMRECASYLETAQLILSQCQGIKDSIDTSLVVDIEGHINNTDNPHSVTSEDVNAYNKSTTDALLSAKANTSDLSTVATSGDYDDLLNKPTIPDAQIQSDWSQSDNTAKDYIKNKPSIPTVPTNLSSFTDDLGSSPTHTHSQYLTSHQDISGKANTSDLSTVATSGDYSDLLNKPTIPDAQVQSNWSESDTTSKAYIQNKPTIPDAQIQSDWLQSDNTAKDYIKNKPSIPTVNDGTITITQGGTTKGTFSVNQSGNTTINLDSGSSSSNAVTTNTAQDITGVKTFVGDKRIKLKQDTSANKLGFTVYDNNNTEVGTFEYRPNTINGIPFLNIGNYATTSAAISYNGFRETSTVSGENGLYNLLCPLVKDARSPFNLTTTQTNFYMPLGFTDGISVIKTDKTGMVALPGGIVDNNGFTTKIGTFDEPKAIQNVSSENVGCILYGNDKFVIVTIEGHSFVSTNNGTTWVKYTPSNFIKIWVDGVYSDRYVILSKNGYIGTSSTGSTNWSLSQPSELSSITDWRTIDYINGKYVILSKGGYFSYSTDLSSWSTPAIANSAITNVAVTVNDGNTVYAINNDGKKMTSTTGTLWTNHVGYSGPTYLYGLEYIPEKNIMIGVDTIGKTYVSEDLTQSWANSSKYEDLAYPPGVTLKGMAYGNGRLFAISNSGGYLSSWDGVKRTSLTLNPDSALSTTSTRPVQNSVITTEINNIYDILRNNGLMPSS